MRKIFLATTLLLGATSYATAADLYIDPVPVAAQTVYDWSGFYGGVFAGYGWGESNFVDNDFYNLAGEEFSLDPKGGLAGITVGYNVQRGSIVFGLEGEVGYLGLDGSVAQPSSPEDSFASINGGIYASLAGRLGVALDRALIYAKGGVAVTGANGKFDDNCDVGACGGGLLNASSSGAMVGYTIGGGIEYALSEQWTAKLEYAYLNFGDATASGVAAGGGTFTYGYDLSAHTVKLGLNYKF